MQNDDQKLMDEGAERALLAVLMKQPDALRELSLTLRAEEFYFEKHRHIYQAIIALDEADEPVDSITLSRHLRDHNLLEGSGGPAYLAGLRSEVPAVTNVTSYLRIVQDCALRRVILETSRKIAHEAASEPGSIRELADSASRRFLDLALSGAQTEVLHIAEPLNEWVATILDVNRGPKDGLTGVPSGFYALDRMTNGWQSGDLIILAARPGMGKTAFALNLLLNAAQDRRGPRAGVIFTLEMAATQLVSRLMASAARVDAGMLRERKLVGKEANNRFITTIPRLQELPIFIDETPQITVAEIARKCRKLAHDEDLGLIIVDYLQLMRGSSSSRNANREQQISEISRGLKALARELKVPVIALSQLNRAVEQRPDKRPMLADLRESGAIEQDADIIIFLYRQAYYDNLAGKDGQDDGPPVPMQASPDGDETEVIIAKHRSGQTGKVMLSFFGLYTLFANRKGDAPPPPSDEDLRGHNTTTGFDPAVDFAPPPPAPLEEQSAPPQHLDAGGWEDALMDDFSEDFDDPSHDDDSPI